MFHITITDPSHIVWHWTEERVGYAARAVRNYQLELEALGYVTRGKNTNDRSHHDGYGQVWYEYSRPTPFFAQRGDTYIISIYSDRKPAESNEEEE